MSQVVSHGSLKASSIQVDASHGHSEDMHLHGKCCRLKWSSSGHTSFMIQVDASNGLFPHEWDQSMDKSTRGRTSEQSCEPGVRPVHRQVDQDCNQSAEMWTWSETIQRERKKLTVRNEQSKSGQPVPLPTASIKGCTSFGTGSRILGPGGTCRSVCEVVDYVGPVPGEMDQMGRIARLVTLSRRPGGEATLSYKWIVSSYSRIFVSKTC